MRYINPTYVRIFFNPFTLSSRPASNTRHWRQFASNSWSSSRFEEFGNQFGKSFGNKDVKTIQEYISAIDEMRTRVRGQAKTIKIADFLAKHKAIKWPELMKRLSEPSTGITLAQNGVPEDFMKTLAEEKYDAMAVWDLDCSEIEFRAVDKFHPEYYPERWETYRLMYIGGAWMAEQGITEIELYNEPDKDSCLNSVRWLDDVRIKSQALQDAYADFSVRHQTVLKPVLIAPTTATSKPNMFECVLCCQYI